VKDSTMESNKVPHSKKAKKKQVKDELDRMKQAEKKRRRLEKALATSAAIRSELEKKKQMKKEEQQRLDEEGAAIAEAVALHVLIEEDATDDSCKILLNDDDEDLNRSHQFGLFVNTRSSFSNEDLQRCGFQSIREIPSSDDGYGYKWNHLGYDVWSVPSRASERSFPLPYLEVEGASWGPTEVSAGFSTLQIGDANVDTIFFNRY